VFIFEHLLLPKKKPNVDLSFNEKRDFKKINVNGHLGLTEKMII